MTRSSGIPRGRGLRGITRIAAARATATTITRPTTSTDSLDSTQETTAEHTERVWLFSPDENSIEVSAGERVTGDLNGLAVEPEDATVDIQKGDRITHGGVEYEVDTVEGRPDDNQTDYWSITFIRRQ